MKSNVFNRKIIILFLCTVLLFGFGGCSQSLNKKTDSIISDYSKTALGHIREGDFESAIAVLEEGIDATNSEKLISMLEAVTADAYPSNTTENSDIETNTEIDGDESLFNKSNGTFDLEAYTEGYWASSDISAEDGGYILKILEASSSDNVYLELTRLQGMPYEREAVADAYVPLSEFADGKVSFTFANDGWGYSGRITLYFEDGIIAFIVTDVQDLGFADGSWGFRNNSGGFLICIPEVYEYIYGDGGDHEEFEDGPIDGASHSSDVWAAHGITEEEFKSNCRSIGYSDGGLCYADLTAYPDDYIGGYFCDSAFPVSSYILENAECRVYLHDYANAAVYDFIDPDCDTDRSPTLNGKNVEMYMVFMGVEDDDGIPYAIFLFIDANEI